VTFVPTPEIPDDVEVVPGTDVDELWRRYQPFEPLHFLQDILTPMSDADVERLIGLLSVRPGMRVLDIACGHGELLLRLAERHDIDAVGIDESPWAIVRAAQRARARSLRGSVRWRLGSGTTVPATEEWDVVACVGASWIWHGFAGTVRAMARRVAPGGRIAVGDLRAREGRPRPGEGRVPTRGEQVEILRDAGLVPLGELVGSDASWLAYQQRVVANAEAYAVATPGHPLRDRRALAAEWLRDQERDRAHLVWSVWVAERPRQAETP